MTTVAALYRHPIKSHGREAIDAVTLTAGQAMPWDRTWAVAHEAAKIDAGTWAPCQNFSRGAKAPGLMAINAKLDVDAGTVTLTHPDCAPLTVNPDRDGAALINWVRPIVPQDRAMPVAVHRLDGRGFTDSDYPTISLCNLASHSAVEQLADIPMSHLRWRGNIWLDGLPAWEEFNWVGREVRIGTAVLRIHEPIVRCLATTANPETGKRDVDTLAALQKQGHQDFGVYADVIKTGDLTLGDTVELI